MSRAPLTAEERALADKLARIAPRAEPSAALDARILAMAAEAHTQATTAPAKPRRWLPPLALAASLALVAGVIWRVHPVLNPQDTPSPTAISEADAAAALPPSMPGTEVMTEAPAELADAAAMPETHATSAAIEMARPSAARKAAPVAMSAPVAEESLQLPPMALPAAAPPLGQAQQAQAAEVQRAGQKVQESHSAKSTAVMSGRAAARNAELAAPPAPPAPAAMMERAAPVAADTSESLDSITLTGTRILPGEMEIARIRALIEQGHTRKARRELKKLMRRHPDIEIPDDLKQLLD